MNKNTRIVGGSIFESESNCLVNPVNCVGIMGAGLAREFKARYPEMYKSYLVNSKASKLKLGEINLYNGYYDIDSEKYIINFPTKFHYREKSSILSIRKGMDSFVEFINKYADQFRIHSVAIPKIGCGLGGLDSDQVLKEITHSLDHVESHKISFDLYWK